MRYILAHALVQASLLSVASASPAPTAFANNVAPPDPVITPSPVEHNPSPIVGRNILSDVQSGVGNVVSGVGSGLPSGVASGVPNFFQGFPTGDAVVSSLGLDSSQLKALPTNVLNIAPYANWTNSGWNVRFHGNVYKQPNISVSTLNDLADVFLVNTSISELPESQQAQARNLTAEIFVVQQPDVAVDKIHLKPVETQGSSGQAGGGGSSNTTGGTQDVTLPYNTTAQGDFDTFVQIDRNGLTAGNETSAVQRLETHVEGASIGNATAYLVPPTGLTILSDIDDLLRVTKIYQPAEGLLNTFARPFMPWENMPEIYRNWSTSLPDTHFHYLASLLCSRFLPNILTGTTPEQITRNYMEFIYNNYPGGSFDTRPLNFSDVSATLSIRQFLLQKIFETFPERKFVLVADTSNSDVMRDYPKLVTDFPGQVQCILIRNTSATDPDSKFPYDTSGFKDLNQSMYMFFVNPDDLTNLDIENGQCYNESIPQNLTFGYQGLPLGLGNTLSSFNGSTKRTGAASGLVNKKSAGVQGLMALVAAVVTVTFMFL
ncbi:hypothetical protein N7489_007791 [Penicillium chrysogenum]|uniref:Phosphatidate phosphatase APP1 catalytic domain-containing protein n=1 Tax=Penicillium chrysogenum TaxID=5076 RepID=A0ABQ8WB19_PENCH|nr:uncharacterized protein N7489_007791 [Penicillium chrysogenum]KAJ5237700.1 hypothetical protein N7489_007791 [Penicillium chrysogenum]KAJ5262035.1 hypothetical protein N7505_008902 [Penicillium chrysogenum]KAJ5278001.1 hypothetical protein N7524_004154 [Penicillium chrysogenum]KAJ6159964.1 hypothetical protein N7497_004501 [Penicillium chrysogenum]